MPDFNFSSATADTLFGVFNVIVIVGTALAFAGTIGTIWTSGVRERYSDLRTSSNESKTAIAGRDAAQANAEAANANLRAAEVEKQNSELRQKFANRRVDAHQHQILVAALSRYPGVFDMQIMRDPESGMYAADILKTLADSGWTVESKSFPLGGNLDRANPVPNR